LINIDLILLSSTFSTFEGHRLKPFYSLHALSPIELMNITSALISRGYPAALPPVGKLHPLTSITLQQSRLTPYKPLYVTPSSPIKPKHQYAPLSPSLSLSLYSKAHLTNIHQSPPRKEEERANDRIITTMKGAVA